MARRKRAKAEETVEEKVEQPVPETEEETVKEVEEETLKEKVEETVVEEAVTKEKPAVKEATKKVSNMSIKAKTVDELLDAASKDSVLDMVASRLSRYRETMKKLHTENEGVARNMDLYRLLLEILNTEDYTKFKAKFDVVNKIVLLDKEGIFNGVAMSRYDYKWTGDTKSHKLYHKLVVVVTELANPNTRAKVLKTIDIENNLPELSDIAKRNIVRYYTS